MPEALSAKHLAVLDVLTQTDQWLNRNKIETFSQKAVTAKTTGTAGDELAKRGLIERKEGSWGGKPQPLYRLAPARPETFPSFVAAYFEGYDRLGRAEAARAALSFLTSPYAKAMLTPDFVRRELARRRVEMRRMVRIEEDGRRPPSETPTSRWATVRLPVAPSEAAIPQTIAKAIDLIEYAKTPQEREGLISFIEEHYADDEPHRLVLPIVALLQVSQGALREFVSDWQRAAKPDDVGMSFNEKGLQMVEPLLFQMIYAAVTDLAAVRAIPKRMDVTWATVCPEPVPVRHEFPRALLEIQWRLEGTIGYWAGFVAQQPFTTPQVTTWWRGQAINGPPPPSQR